MTFSTPEWNIQWLWCAVAVLSCISSVAGQDLARVQGRVVDEDSGEPLEFASISLLSPIDSSVISGTISGADGQFALKAEPGVYHVRSEFLSYQPAWVLNVELDKVGDLLTLGNIGMHLSSAMLDMVEITGEKSQFQLGLDKKIFNVDKDIVTRGGSAADILDNIPSVSVDLDGNVSLRGSQNVRILIDGRPSGLVGLSDNSALRLLQGDLVERVEIVTNPSARYDAEGMAGIINIVLKKQQDKGLNGSFTANAGYPAVVGGSASLNYRKKNVNLFANYGLSYSDRPGGGMLYQEYSYDDSTHYLEQDQDRANSGISNTFRFGADAYLNEHNILTGTFMYRISNQNNESTNTYHDFDEFYAPTTVTVRNETEEEDVPTIEYSLNYKHQFPQKGHVLTASIQYDDNRETEDADFVEQVFDPDQTPAPTPIVFQHSLNTESNHSWVGQVDYVRPLHNDGRFEAGYKFSLRSIETSYFVEEEMNDIWEPIEGFVNDFNYDENIHAAYLIYGQQIGDFSYQAGLRAEYSHVITELLQTAEKNDRSYFDLFPSMHIGYDLGGENTIQVSYSRRINRPRFHWLNPFFTFTDPRNRWGGNPNLDPEYTTSLELGHIKYWDKGSLTSSIYYRHTTDVVNRIRSITEDGITESIPQNLASRDDYGFEFTFAKDLLEPWKVDGNLNLFQSVTHGGQYGEANNFNWSARVNSRVTVFKRLETQLRLNYRGPQETTQGRNKATFHADIGISMDVLRSRGTLTLNVSDVLNSRKYRYISEGIGFYSEGEWQWRARQTTLNFTYRLNQRKEKQNREGGREGIGDDMEMF